MTTIALAGKGGTGKTTIAALIIRHLVQWRLGAVLAIDADPATNLHLALGLPLATTIGDIREGMPAAVQAGAVGTGVSRHDYLSSAIRLAVEEGDFVDLLAMGRPEGAGCYCAVNHLLRQIVDGLAQQYDFVVMDNEAGMEHLSRRTTRDVDVLLLVTDPTMRGFKAAEAMVKMAGELEINVGRLMLVVNRVQGDLPPVLREALDGLGIELSVEIPSDPRVNEFDAVGRPLFDLADDSAAVQTVGVLAGQLLRIPVAA